MTRSDVILWTCIRAAGNGLALMPIMTGGLAAVPDRYTSSGTTLNNIVQRVAGSLGLSLMTVLQVNQQSQLMADRSTLLPANSADPRVQDAVSQGASAMYGMYQQLSAEVVAGSYSDVFYVMAMISAGGVLLALMLRKPAASVEAAAAAVTITPAATPAVSDASPLRAPTGPNAPARETVLEETSRPTSESRSAPPRVTEPAHAARTAARSSGDHERTLTR
jgi:hypothetical protein